MNSRKTIIRNGTIVNEGRKERADIIIDNDRIDAIIYDGNIPRGDYYEIDAAGCFVLPGVIDSHVHFRDPGLTHKADIESESRAAAYGGVTSYFDMPNTKPQTTTIDALNDKFQRAAEVSHVNYSFFYGATNDNVDTFDKLDVTRIPGIKLFMGSSTGNMLVDNAEMLNSIFAKAAQRSLPVMAHCEDTDIIDRNAKEIREKYGDNADISFHPVIRSAEACYDSSQKAVELASKSGAHLHIAHLSTADELTLLDKDNVTAEATVAHLLFDEADYSKLGGRIKCNPSIKSAADREALLHAVADGRIQTIGTDHAPHTLEEKQGGALQAVSGMPMLQFSLVMMLGLSDEGYLSIEKIVELMCHNPAQIFGVCERGFLLEGYKADIAIVSPCDEYVITKDDIQSKCGWSPVEGHTVRWAVKHTLCNGMHIYNNGVFDLQSQGEEIRFCH
ncbi:MAG: dihydroorotase [Prevotella sp.]|nr:dihydroorotase [Prevotella sp.]